MNEKHVVVVSGYYGTRNELLKKYIEEKFSEFVSTPIVIDNGLRDKINLDPKKFNNAFITCQMPPKKESHIPFYKKICKHGKGE